MRKLLVSWWRALVLLGVFVVAGAVVTGCQTSSAGVGSGVRAEADETSGLTLHRYHFASAHMGTQFGITLYATNLGSAEAAAEAAFRRVNQLDAILSDYKADSELNGLREKPVGVSIPVSTDLWWVLTRSRTFARFTHGAFDPTVGPYVRLWRFSRKRKSLPTEAELSTARACVGWEKLEVERGGTVKLLAAGMQLDVGGIAKGFAADEALEVLRRHGIDRAFVAASGDIAIGKAPPGKPGWRVEIEGLGQGSATNGAYVLSNCGISTSGDAEHFVEIDGRRYSHIVDPRTGLGIQHRVQVTVVAQDATTTDALATAACVLGVKPGSAALSRAGATGRFVWVDDGRTRTLAMKGFPKQQ